jgi:hypothetical protein
LYIQNRVLEGVEWKSNLLAGNGLSLPLSSG